MAGVKLYNKTGDEKAVRTQEAIEKKFGFIPEVFQAMVDNEVEQKRYSGLKDRILEIT